MEFLFDLPRGKLLGGEGSPHPARLDEATPFLSKAEFSRLACRLTGSEQLDSYPDPPAAFGTACLGVAGLVSA